MNNIELEVIKQNVYEEVARTSSYAGAKMQEDEKAYERIFATDSDRNVLERFWIEACNASTDQLKPFITYVNEHTIGDTNNYEVSLELSSSFDTSLKGSIETSLFSFFVSYITSKWFKFTNKGEVESYAVDASGALDDVMKKIYYRKKPTRVKPSSNSHGGTLDNTIAPGGNVGEVTDETTEGTNPL